MTINIKNVSALQHAFMDEIYRLNATPDDYVEGVLALTASIFIGLGDKITLDWYLNRVKDDYKHFVADKRM